MLDKKEKETETNNKFNKKLFLIIVICVTALIILFIILKLDNIILSNDSIDNYEINRNDNYNDISNDEINNNSEYDKESIDGTEIKYQEYSHHIDITASNLYVNNMEKQYTNYSKLTETNYHDKYYYIKDGKLFKKDNETISEVSLNGETAKYIATGWSGCSGNEIMILTEEGNIYSIDMTFAVNKKYSGGNAKEFLYINNEPQLFSTCSIFVAYALINDKLYRLPFSNGENISERSLSHPYSLILDRGNEYIERFEYLFYPDGSINKYVYFYGNNTIQNEFIKKENGEKLLISFLYKLDESDYLVDTDGNVYEIIHPTTSSKNGYAEVKLKQINESNKKVKYIDLYYNFKKNIKANKTISSNYMITFNYDDGTMISYTTADNREIYFSTVYFDDFN